MKYFYLPLFFFSLLFITSCGDDDQLSPEEQLEIDIEKIQEYLTDNGLAAQSTASGLHYIIEEEGEGNHPSLNNTVKVRYTGYFLNGDIFDQQTGNPIQFPLNQVIEGWQEGIRLLKRGGKGTLFVPSELGYGSDGFASIPGNTVLIFDVELVDF